MKYGKLLVKELIIPKGMHSCWIYVPLKLTDEANKLAMSSKEGNQQVYGEAADALYDYLTQESVRPDVKYIGEGEIQWSAHLEPRLWATLVFYKW